MSPSQPTSEPRAPIMAASNPLPNQEPRSQPGQLAPQAVRETLKARFLAGNRAFDVRGVSATVEHAFTDLEEDALAVVQLAVHEVDLADAAVVAPHADD